jgi:predicted transport protein
MPIFSINNNIVNQLGLKKEGFGGEFSLRDFFADNLETLLGIRFLAKEYQTTDGRIDTLGLDENSAPVIIEYKWKQNEEVLSQGLFYFDWLLKNKHHFDLLADKILGQKIKVNWNTPRVILIAQGFSRYVKAAAQCLENVELITYALYDGDMLQIEREHTPLPSSAKFAKKPPSISDISQIFSLDFHLNSTTPEVRALVNLLREQMLQLPEVEEKLNQKTGISYRTTKSFARFEFRKTWVQLLLRAPEYPEDSQGLVKDITSNGWGYLGMLKLTAQSDMKYVFNLIKASYDSTL